MKPSFIVIQSYRFLVNNFYLKPRGLYELVTDKEFYDSSSYYPEKESHSVLYNFMYQLGQVLKYGTADRYYFMYGLDVKPRDDRKQYLHYDRFMRRRDYLNNLHEPHNSTCILRNKLYFDIIAKSLGLSTPSILAYTQGGQLFVWNENHYVEGNIDYLLKQGPVSFFCKETDGECGNGIFIINIDEKSVLSIDGVQVSVEKVMSRLLRTDYLIQSFVNQHNQMNMLYDGSINTMRLVTVRSLKDGLVHVMPSILRIGSNGGIVDNTSQGGIAIGFDLETGQLHEDGFFKPAFGRRIQVHPNSGIRFRDFYIPFIKEAEEQAIKFHSFLKDIHSIGWDIAIGQDGPIFIEGNDNWEINGPQVGNHGLRKEFEDYFFK